MLPHKIIVLPGNCKRLSVGRANMYVVAINISPKLGLPMQWLKHLKMCCHQAQACGALADWLRHQPEYSSLAPKALENFNLASSFMSKVRDGLNARLEITVEGAA